MHSDPRKALSEMDRSDARIMNAIAWILVLLILIGVCGPALILSSGG